MSAVNPVLLFEGAMTRKKEEIVKGLAASVTVGDGQFCTDRAELPLVVILLRTTNHGMGNGLFLEKHISGNMM